VFSVGVDTNACDVLVVGASISGLMCAAWIKLEQPDLDVVVLGPPPEREKRPYVGESLVEPAILFFRELGMGEVLDKTCALKNGLTFYYKLRLGDPSDRRYSVHAPEELYHLARQIHRPVFDRALRDHAERLGVRLVDGLAEEVRVGSHGARHHVRARVGDAAVEMSSRWIVDATGRRRLIGEQVSSYTRPEEGQRSAFWIRLAGFEPFLPHIEMSMRRPVRYDLWYSTHHFMGTANWIWGIPLQSKEHERLISFGITYRPDIFPFADRMRTVEHFLDYLDGEHPALAAFVRSGQVLDTNVYRNYIYWADRIYSTDGWFLIGDAARAVDPLYSTGMSMTSIQSLQVSEMIRRQRRSALSIEDVAALESAWMKVARRMQGDITHQYASMHDPLQAAMRRYWNVCGWFNAVLPLWFNGFLSDPAGARLVAGFVRDPDTGSESAWSLFGEVAKRLGPALEPEVFDRTSDLDEILDHRFDCPLDDVPAHLAGMLVKRARLRLSLARMGGSDIVRAQVPIALGELARASATRLLFKRVGREAFRSVRPPLHRIVKAGVAGAPSHGARA
jgi:flavin-dependent dehydrogenase